MKTRYITADDFLGYYGMDLAKELTGVTPEQFLRQVEDFVARELDASYFQKVDDLFPEFSDYQKEHYKLALLNQAYYVFRNSDISTDSGYDPERGTVQRGDPMAPEARKELMLCGLLTRDLRSVGEGGLWL